MASLDNEDLKAIKGLLEITIDEVFEKQELTTKKDIGRLPTKDEFVLQTGRILKGIANLKLAF